LVGASTCEMKMNEEIKEKVRNIVLGFGKRLTPADVERMVSTDMGVDRKVVRVAIKELVSEGVLRYTYFGSSFLERSFDRPVRVSERIVVKPPHRMYTSKKDDIVINIKSGASFGNGGHPSTYLILRALDGIFSSPNYLKGRSLSRALDVGTGTGILAIAAAKFGIREIIGIDIDRVALFEARDNIKINDLTEQITVSNTPLEDIRSLFSLIMANIGYKTLEALCPLLVERIEEEGILILSGFSLDGCESLLRTYLRDRLTLLHRQTEQNWVCLVFSK
jgi:ribosomal protein L11 methyltransferase